MSQANEAVDVKISAMPTKAFFVEMFTKDIPLDQAVLDLVDNSVDGAKRTPKPGAVPYEDMVVELEFSKERFRIWDNCGGFSRKVAAEYAFRFGRPKGSDQVKGSIGQFGVGMKRALFKFGRRFEVHSATASESWGVDVHVDVWSDDENGAWAFPWKDSFTPEADLSQDKPGTEIIVTEIRPSVAGMFATEAFQNQIKAAIKSKHRSFLRDGLTIKVNGDPLTPLDLTLMSDEVIAPGVWSNVYSDEGKVDIHVRLIAGVATSAPRLAGWYVICNGRIVLDADRRDVTGWGVVEDAATKTTIPGFHNQFARFRGIASFECDDSSRLPWNTTKTDVDQDNDIWRTVREQMIEMTRPVINFLNELDADIEENGRDKSPLTQALQSARIVSFESISEDADLVVPDREDLPAVTRYVKIQYSRKVDDVEFLKKVLNVETAKAVGEQTFDLILKKQRS